MPRPSPPLPSPLDYTDYRVFLKAWLDAKTAATPGYTLGRFARAAGCSVSHVRNVIHEERPLNPPYVDNFITAMKLPREQGEFFCTLVRYAHAKDSFEKAAMLRQMVGRLVFHGAPIPEGLAYVVLMDLRSGAIHEAAHSCYFQDDPHWVARMMNILPEQAAASLGALKAAGLLVVGEDGRVRPVKPAYSVPVSMVEPLNSQLQDDAICAARRAVRGPAEDRRFFVLTGPTARADLPALRMLANDFIARVNGLLSQAPQDDDSVVYAAQIQLLPGADAGSL